MTCTKKKKNLHNKREGEERQLGTEHLGYV